MDTVKSRSFSGFNTGFYDRMFEKMRVGNKAIREEFIGDHEQFICTVISNVTGKTLVEKSTDEYKIGISAFDYAISTFEGSKYEEFLNFSEQILTEWVTAYKNKDRNSIREEIVLLKNKMWEFGISMEDLIKETPVNRSTIASCIEFARNLIVTESAFSNFSLRKDSNDADTEEIKRIFLKKVRRNRKYITAISLIFISELEDLKIYLENISNKKLTLEKIGIVLEYSMEKVVFMTEHGRFVMADSLKNYQIGQRIYFNDKTGIQKYAVKYSLVAAGVLAVVFIGYFAFSNISLNIFDGGQEKPGKVSVVVNSEKKDAESKAPTAKQEDVPEVSPEEILPDTATSTPSNNDTVIEGDQVKPASQGPGEQNEPALDKKPVPARTHKIVGVKNTPVSKKPTIKTNPTVAPVKTLPGKNALTTAAPIGYPTVKATGVPGTPRIKSDNYELNVGQDYTIRMYLNSGNNGTKWVLYENGAAILTSHNPDNTPDAQAVWRLFTAKKPGTYNYKCELINSFGTSTSSDITIVVK